ncbi:MAG: thermonuclease family protein, partial [Rhizobiaceae bacterium]
MRKRRLFGRQSLLKKSRAADYLVAAALIAIVAAIVAILGAGNSEEYVGSPDVADGDSIVLQGERIRLEGIDSPEIGQSCNIAGRSYDCGLAARNHLRKLINRNTVICSGWLYDKYDRLLATCMADGTDLNSQMVSDGWALAFGGYEAEESEARENKRGVWQGDFMRPREWRIE